MVSVMYRLVVRPFKMKGWDDDYFSQSRVLFEPFALSILDSAELGLGCFVRSGVRRLARRRRGRRESCCKWKPVWQSEPNADEKWFACSWVIRCVFCVMDVDKAYERLKRYDGPPHGFRPVPKLTGSRTHAIHSTFNPH